MGTAAATLPCLDIGVAGDGPCLSISQLEQLMLPVAKQDMDQALKGLPLDKFPGIDSFNAEFFKSYWQIIGEEVTEGILQFFENGKLLKGTNITTITLVPKVPNPTYVKEYRPIACCTPYIN